LIVEGTLAEILAWIEPRALLLAIVLPPVIRLVGHFLPEEVFMVSMGVLAARTGSPREASVLLLAVVLSHFVTDQTVYLGGRWLRPRLDRFPRIRDRLSIVTNRLSSSPLALLWFVPARVFPFARGAWLAGCGVMGVTWRRFIAIDLVALSVHLLTWSGLGWWLAGDLAKLESTTNAGKVTATWAVLIIASIMLTWFGWRHRRAWQPTTVRVARRLGRTLFPPHPSDNS
jgi:membrane protein DedA with SNARE-associated domain